MSAAPCATPLRAAAWSGPSGMELPPDFAEEAKTISDFRRTLEAQRLGSMDPMDAKSAVARWHSDVQSLTSKLAAQLTYSR